MTCIVGLLDKGNVYMGGDSAGVAGLSISVRNDEKVFTNGPFIMGFTSSFRMGQLLRYKFDPPKQTVGVDDMKYMVTDFVEAVRSCFSQHGYGTGKDQTGGTFLVGYNGVLYTIDSDFQVGIPGEAYDAVGCGADLALGAMFASKGKKPEERVKVALEAAAMFSGGVLPPFVILKQTKSK
jgi:ATP-dependent protease HslVU (ClpYQ) peptidase subunit